MQKYDENDKARLSRSITDDRQETAAHGSAGFPCAAYLDRYQSEKDFYPLHWHDALEVTCVAKGQVWAQINAKRILLHEGEGIFVNRRTLHAFSGSSGAGGEMPNILFRPVLLYGAPDSVFWDKYIKPLLLCPGLTHVVFRPDNAWQTECLANIQLAFSQMQNTPFGYELRTRAALSEIAVQLCQNAVSPAMQAPADQAAAQRMQNMLAFIEAHYTEPLTLQQIAGSAFISRRECLRLFHQMTGTSPVQYVIGLRIRKAKALLCETQLPMTEIGSICGFQDQSYFTKMFRERAGLSPARFRKVHAKT